MSIFIDEKEDELERKQELKKRLLANTTFERMNNNNSNRSPSLALDTANNMAFTREEVSPLVGGRREMNIPRRRVPQVRIC